MTEAQLRKKYIDCAKDYYGAVMGDRRHMEIVDAYNSFTPHPRGHKLTASDNWCAAFVSAISVLCCMTDIIPVECSCNEQIKLWQQLGRWEENDKHIPSIGDLLYYDWDDRADFAQIDNKGVVEHVGIVVWTSGSDILVLEGNKGTKTRVVGYREMNVNGRYIRGYGCPDFASKAMPETCSATLPVLIRGSKGEAVSSLQWLLNLYGAALAIDGSFGPATDAAVRDFQRGAGLDADGSVGPMTWAALIG